MPSITADRQTREDTLQLIPTRGIEQSNPQGRQQYHLGSLDPVRPIRGEGGTRPATAAPGSKIAAGSVPAYHSGSETAITINDITDASAKMPNWAVIKTVGGKAERIFQFLESSSRSRGSWNSLNSIMGIKATEDAGASMYFQIQEAVILSYQDLVLSIREGMSSIEFEMNDQINRAARQERLPVSQSSQHLTAVAIRMSVIKRVFLLLASFLNVYSNVDAIRRSVANVNAYMPKSVQE